MKLWLAKRDEDEEKRERKRSKSNQNVLRNQTSRSRKSRNVFTGGSQLTGFQLKTHEQFQRKRTQQMSSPLSPKAQTPKIKNTSHNNTNDLKYIFSSQAKKLNKQDQKNQETCFQHEDNVNEEKISTIDIWSTRSSSPSSNQLPQQGSIPGETNKFEKELPNILQETKDLQEQIPIENSQFPQNTQEFTTKNQEKESLQEEIEDILRKNIELVQVCKQLQLKCDELEAFCREQNKISEELEKENTQLKMEIQIMKQEQDKSVNLTNDGGTIPHEKLKQLCILENERTNIQNELKGVQAENARLSRIMREKLETDNIIFSNVSQLTRAKNELFEYLQREQTEAEVQRKLAEQFKGQIKNLEALNNALGYQIYEQQIKVENLEKSQNYLQGKIEQKLIILKKAFRFVFGYVHLKKLLTSERQQHLDKLSQVEYLFKQSQQQQRKTEMEFERLSQDYSGLSMKLQEQEKQRKDQGFRDANVMGIIEGTESLTRNVQFKGIENLEKPQREIELASKVIKRLQGQSSELQKQLSSEKDGNKNQVILLGMKNQELKTQMNEVKQIQENKYYPQEVNPSKQQQELLLSLKINGKNNDNCPSFKDIGQTKNKNERSNICSFQLFNFQSENCLFGNQNIFNNQNTNTNSIHDAHSKNEIDTELDLIHTLDEKKHHDEVHRILKDSYTPRQEKIGCSPQHELKMTSSMIGNFNSPVAQITSNNKYLSNYCKGNQVLQQQQISSEKTNTQQLISNFEKEINYQRVFQEEELLQFQNSKRQQQEEDREEILKKNQDWWKKVNLQEQTVIFGDNQSLEDRIKWYPTTTGGKSWKN